MIMIHDICEFSLVVGVNSRTHKEQGLIIVRYLAIGSVPNNVVLPPLGSMANIYVLPILQTAIFTLRT